MEISLGVSHERQTDHGGESQLFVEKELAKVVQEVVEAMNNARTGTLRDIFHGEISGFFETLRRFAHLLYQKKALLRQKELGKTPLNGGFLLYFIHFGLSYCSIEGFV